MIIEVVDPEEDSLRACASLFGRIEHCSAEPGFTRRIVVSFAMGDAAWSGSPCARAQRPDRQDVRRLGWPTFTIASGPSTAPGGASRGTCRELLRNGLTYAYEFFVTRRPSET
ncbi:MAG: hypothetical protein GY711_25615 [bacterium]|nr:hypothetical protein [bacterium]